MRFARKLALTATLFGFFVPTALPAYAEQEVDNTYYPPVTEPAAPSRQHPTVAKKSKASASSVAHPNPS